MSWRNSDSYWNRSMQKENNDKPRRPQGTKEHKDFYFLRAS